MKFPSFLSLAFVALISVSNGQDTAVPTITDVTPEAGVLLDSDNIVFAGNVADTTNDAAGDGETAIPAGVAAVEYRTAKDKKWRRATLTTGGETSSLFVFTIKLGKGKGTTVYIRARDVNGNESDILGRQVKRSHLRREFQTTPTTTTTTTTE